MPANTSVQSERYEVHLGSAVGDPTPTQKFFYDFATRGDAQILADLLQKQVDTGHNTVPPGKKWYVEPIDGPSVILVDPADPGGVDAAFLLLGDATVLQLFFVLGAAIPGAAVRAVALSVAQIRALRAGGVVK